MTFNARDYKSLILDFPEELDSSRLTNVHIPQYSDVKIFRTYTGIAIYLAGNQVPEIHITRTNVVRDGMYDNLYDVGNRGFKRSYLKVYDRLQSHTEHGTYVGWMVHI
jgi:hypothetical protein